MSIRKTTFEKFYRYFIALYIRNSLIVVLLFYRFINLTVYWVCLWCWISVWSLNHWTVSSKLQSEGGRQLKDYNQHKIKKFRKYLFYVAEHFFNCGSLWNWFEDKHHAFGWFCHTSQVLKRGIEHLSQTMIF